MDILLEFIDTHVADYVYASLLPAPELGVRQYEPATVAYYQEPSPASYMSALRRDDVYRQFITLFFITWFFGLVNYFLFSTISYLFLFDKSTLRHPKFIKNQIWGEICQTVTAMPTMAFFTALCFLLEVRGYSRLYDPGADGSASAWWYQMASPLLFILFTDWGIYWIHRALHHPLLYKYLHKPHHRWIMPSPYACYAFHPLDGFAQSLPYHIYPFLFPLHKFVYLGLFMFVNIWTISIHDELFIANDGLINGAACHTAHHLYFNYNYGQFMTIWDRLGGTYRKPNHASLKSTVANDAASFLPKINPSDKAKKQI